MNVRSRNLRLNQFGSPQNTAVGKFRVQQTQTSQLLTFIVAILMLTQISGIAYAQPLNSGSTSATASVAQNLIGTLYARWSDPKPGSRAKSYTEYWLLAANNQVYNLQLSKAFQQANSNLDSLVTQQVKVSGLVAANSKAQAGAVSLQVNALVALNKGQPKTQPRLSGSKPFISIMCKFADITDEPQNVDYFRNQLTGPNNAISFDKYIRELSYNQVNLQGSDAEGWFTLPKTRTTYVNDAAQNFDSTTLAQDCTNAALQANVNFNGYYGINLMFNGSLGGVSLGGYQQLSLTGQSQSWHVTWLSYDPPAPGTISGSGSIFGWPTQGVMAHEMAHSFGAPHSNDANGYQYGSDWDAVSNPSWNCTDANGNLTQFVDPAYGCTGQGIIAYSKLKMGFLPTSQVLYYDGSMGAKAVTLERLDQPTNNNPLLILVPIPGTTDQYYSVEARYRVGFDAKLPTDAVLIHRVDGSKGGLDVAAQLVAPPNSTDPGGAGVAWLPGTTFSDTANNISISVQNATATGFVVVINSPQSVSLATTQTNSGPPTAANNNTITFTTTVSVAGAVPANNVIINTNFDLPFNSYNIPIPFTTTLGTYDPNAGVWTLGNVQPGTAATLAVSFQQATGNAARLARTVTTNSTLGGFAIAHADNFTPADDNNSYFASSGSDVADLDLLQTVSDNEPYVGDVVTFTLSALNVGPADATNVTIANQLQAGLSFIAASTDTGSYNATNGVWTIPSLPNQQEALLNITAKVTLPQALTLTATKTGETQADLDTINDSDYATVFGTPYIPLPYYDSAPVGPEILDGSVDAAGNPIPYDGQIDFGSTGVGKPITSNLTIINSGDAPLIISNAAFAGTNASDFKVSLPVSATIAPNGQLKTALQCVPTDVGTRDAYLSINTNDPTLNQALYHLDCIGLYDPGYVPPAAYTYYLPYVANNVNGVTSYVTVQNVGAVTANVQVQYYDGQGNTLSVQSAACSNLAIDGSCVAPNILAANTSGIGQISSNQPLSVIVAESNQYGGSAYVVGTSASNALIAPLAINNSGGFSTQLTVANVGVAAATATVTFYTQNGTVVSGATQTLNLAAHTSQTLNQAATNSGLAAGFYGWATISGVSGSQLVAQILEQRPDIGFTALTNAPSVAGQSVATTLYAPAIFNRAFGAFVTGANIVNPNATPVTVTISYYKNDGTLYQAAPFSLNAYSIASVYHAGSGGTQGLPAIGLPAGFYGSATVSATGPVAMVVNEAGGTTALGSAQSGTYAAINSGGNSVGVPVVANLGFGSFTSGLTILNTSNTTLSGTISYYNSNGTLVGSNQPFTIAPHASQPFYQGAANLPSGFYGQAVVNAQNGSAANSLIVTTNVQNSNLFYTYTEPTS